MRFEKRPSPARRSGGAFLCCLLLALARCDAPEVTTAEEEVLENLRAQPVGRHTLADLRLPEEFLRRVADRIVVETWLEREQRVHAPGWPAPPPPSVSPRRPARLPFPRVLEAPSPRLEGFPEATRPALRGYRVPWGEAAVRFPSELPTPGTPRAGAEALVSTRLHEGLVVTTIRVLDLLGPGVTAAELATVGLPVDLLAFVVDNDVPLGDHREALARLVAARADDPGASPEALGARFRVRFRPTRPGFAASAEDGSEALTAVRLQLPRGDSFRGVGDGSGVDLARQLAALLPRVPSWIVVRDEHVATLQRTAATWETPPSVDAVLLAVSRPVTQWAQDNAKPGSVAGRRALLLPRYPSRREDGSELVPGEVGATAAVGTLGVELVSSPLLFQGGDILISRPPARPSVAWVGEAEVLRNRTLGLAPEEVVEAFRAELGVDRVEVLPSVSFHIDFDLTVRAHPLGPTALVNDPEGAARLVVDAAAETLGIAPSRVAEWIARHRRPDGTFEGSAVRSFSERGGPEAIGAFQRFLTAVDLLGARDPVEATEPGHAGAYRRALQRLARSRALLHEMLRDAGLRVVEIPAFSAGTRSLGYLNGLHTQDRYLMPAWGPPYEAVDRAAAREIEAALPGVEVAPVLTAESQRRQGGLHCAASVWTRAEPGEGP